MTVKERFLEYIQLETTSDPACDTCPSTPGQWNLARLLVEQMRKMGIADARVDEHCYVYGTIPAKGDHPEKIGLIAHMDTSDAVPGATKPVCIPDYDGGPITLKNGVVIDGFDFLPSLKGQELIVTSGDSVLGSDDKAGVAEIMSLAEYLVSPEAPEHGTVCIGFTPDEEIGRGADLFDVKGFGADFAYTVDGGALGELNYENFNADSCLVTVKGTSIHPGSAKNQMVNAALVAAKFAAMLPDWMTPAHTEGYEGFIHLAEMSGDCEQARLGYILRDHDLDKLMLQRSVIRSAADFLNAQYGEGTVQVEIRESYRNMKQQLTGREDILRRAENAFTACGVKPDIVPIRGGTDGARLSYMGLPCPNLSTGGYNFHGRKELITVEAMETMVEVLKKIIIP